MEFGYDPEKFRKNFSRPARSNKYSPLTNGIKPVCSCKDSFCPYEKGTRGASSLSQENLAELFTKPNLEIKV